MNNYIHKYYLLLKFNIVSFSLSKKDEQKIKALLINKWDGDIEPTINLYQTKFGKINNENEFVNDKEVENLRTIIVNKELAIKFICFKMGQLQKTVSIMEGKIRLNTSKFNSIIKEVEKKCRE